MFAVVAVPAALLASLRREVRQQPAWRLWALLAVTSLAVAVAFPLPTPRFQLLPVALTFAFCGGIGELWRRDARVVAVLALTAVVLTGAVAVDRLRGQIGGSLDRAEFLATEDYVESAATAFGAGERMWVDTSWSDYAFAAVYGLTGPHQDQRVYVGSLDGLSPERACAALPRGADHVYVVADASVPVGRVTATYAAPMFTVVNDVSRRGPHGVQRRTLFAVSDGCRALARLRG
jgi:hypothetical protein